MGDERADLRRVQRLTAYAVIKDERDRVLLVRASKESDVPGWWFLPGGGVDHGEHPEETVARELLEETGLSVALTGLQGVTGEVWPVPARGVLLHSVRLIYGARVTGGALRPESVGSSDGVRWVDELEAGTLKLMPFVAEVLGLA